MTAGRARIPHARRHAAVFTVEQANGHRAIAGPPLKNLFLRNKKEGCAGVALEDRALDLKRLGEALGAGRLSFGSPARSPVSRRRAGSVTPFAVINDTEHKVRLVLDDGLKDGLPGDVPGDGPVNAHPLTTP